MILFFYQKCLFRDKLNLLVDEDIFWTVLEMHRICEVSFLLPNIKGSEEPAT
jgi:hypothetical protein